MSSIDCLCVGIIVADHLCEPIAHMPVPGELVMSRRLSLAIGGCASNVSTDLAKLGVNVSLVGRVGTDIFGDFVRQALTDGGVDTTHLISTPGYDTAGTLIVNVQEEDRRFIHAFGANAAFDGSEVTDEMIRSCRVFYVGGFLLLKNLPSAEIARWFRIAREAGIPTMLDIVIPEPADYHEHLATVLPWTDVFLPNDDEARVLTGLTDPLAQAERFHSLGVRTSIITCGGGGAVMICPDGRFRSGRFDVPFVDGTGSGDAFAAGYILGLLTDQPPTRCLEIGSALGASAVRTAGATQGVFRREELDDFLSRNRLGIELI
jgi:sugar/nucleoside kinase (ribokinase family)